MSPTLLLVIYCALILLASLAGGWIPMLIRLTHKRMELAVSFVAGVMLGVGVLHMLPHAIQMRMEPETAHNQATVDEHALAHALINPIMLWLLAGFLAMFFIERFFCFHHHDAPSEDAAGDQQDHEHGDGSSHGHHHDQEHRHALTWTGTAVGMTLHSLIDGIALAASVEAARQVVHGDHVHNGGTALAGIGTFFVILLHKPFDSLTLGTMMSLGKRSMQSRHLINGLFSLMIVAGVAVFHLGLMSDADRGGLVSAALAFSAGTFLCIAMSDLLPELQFHQHDRGKLSAALLLGLGVAWGIGLFEARMH